MDEASRAAGCSYRQSISCLREIRGQRPWNSSNGSCGWNCSHRAKSRKAAPLKAMEYDSHACSIALGSAWPGGSWYLRFVGTLLIAVAAHCAARCAAAAVDEANGTEGGAAISTANHAHYKTDMLMCEQLIE